MKQPSGDPKRQFAMVKTTPQPKSTPDKQPSRKRKRHAKKAVAAKPRTIKLVGSEEMHKAVTNPMAKHLIGRLYAVIRCRGTDYPTGDEQDFAVNAFTELAPTNAAEVLLVSQMVATWEVGMAMVTGAKFPSCHRRTRSQASAHQWTDPGPYGGGNSN